MVKEHFGEDHLHIPMEVLNEIAQAGLATEIINRVNEIVNVWLKS